MRLDQSRGRKTTSSLLYNHAYIGYHRAILVCQHEMSDIFNQIHVLVRRRRTSFHKAQLLVPRQPLGASFGMCGWESNGKLHVKSHQKGQLPTSALETFHVIQCLLPAIRASCSFDDDCASTLVTESFCLQWHPRPGAFETGKCVRL